VFTIGCETNKSTTENNTEMTPTQTRDDETTGETKIQTKDVKTTGETKTKATTPAAGGMKPEKTTEKTTEKTK